MNQNPYVFIVGCARSGTTLLHRILDAHPQITITPEMHWVANFKQPDSNGFAEGVVNKEFIQSFLTHKRFPQLGITPADFEALIGADEKLSYREFLNRIFELYRRLKGKALVGNKTPSYLFRIPTLHHLWPTARFVHLIRDGRDVCLSVTNWKKGARIVGRYATWTKDPVSTIAFWWRQKVLLGRHAGSSLAPELYYELRYEDLVREPERACRELCEFLAVPFSDAMLRFHEGRTRTQPNLQSKSAWLPITPGLRDWRTQMPASDVERFEAAAGGLLEELGYARQASHTNPDARERAASIYESFHKGSTSSLTEESMKGRSNNPYLFVVGCARSGTTLLQRMLDHHPLLAVANEARFMLRIAENGSEGADLPLVPELIQWVRKHHRFPQLGLPDAALDKAGAQAGTYTEFISALYGEYGKLHGKPLVGEKTPRYVRYLPLLHKLYPRVKTLHIIRDGRDVALSTLQWARNKDKGPARYQLWLEQPLATCALWWERQVGGGRLDGRALGRDRYLEVKYEQLVNLPEETLRDVTEFLELPFAAEMLSYNAGKVRHKTGLSSKKAWLPPTPGLRDWRNDMGEADVELFEAIAGELLSALDYERVFPVISPKVAKTAEQCRNWWETEMAVRAGY